VTTKGELIPKKVATKDERSIPKKAAKSDVKTPTSKALARDNYRTTWFAQARKEEKRHAVVECNESDDDRKMAAVSNNNRNMAALPRDGKNEAGASEDETQEEGEVEDCTPESKLENANLVDGIMRIWLVSMTCTVMCRETGAIQTLQIWKKDCLPI
jgi:hypothetical protein